MIFVGFVASSVLQGKDPFAPGATITQPSAKKATAADSGQQQPKHSHKAGQTPSQWDLDDLLLLILLTLFDHVLARLPCPIFSPAFASGWPLRENVLGVQATREILHFDFMLDSWLLDKNRHGCKSLTNFAYPVIFLQGSKSSGNRFIERFGSDIDGMLNFLDVSERNCAWSQNHEGRLAYSLFIRHRPYRCGRDPDSDVLLPTAKRYRIESILWVEKFSARPCPMPALYRQPMTNGTPATDGISPD
jgi:hypothetical protein